MFPARWPSKRLRNLKTVMEWRKRLNQSVARLPLAGQIEVLDWAYEAHLPDNVPHRHTYFEVCQIGDYGRGEFRVEGIAHAISSGDVFIARPGVVHQIVNTARRKMELSWLCFGWTPDKNVNKTSHETFSLLRAFSDSDVLVSHDEDKNVASVWNALRVAAQSDVAIGQSQQLHALSSALVLSIAQNGTDLARGADRVLESDDAHRLAKLATRYIHDNLDRRLTVEEIASQVHLSPRHLTRLMHDFTGTSPAIYIERARMDRARALLLHSSTQIKEIARQIGYADVHHFTRVCTRVLGSSPTNVRAQRNISKHDVPNRQKIGALV